MSEIELQHMLQEKQSVELREIPHDTLAHQEADQHDEHDLQVLAAEQRFRERRLGEAPFFADALEQR